MSQTACQSTAFGGNTSKIICKAFVTRTGQAKHPQAVLFAYQVWLGCPEHSWLSRCPATWLSACGFSGGLVFGSFACGIVRCARVVLRALLLRVGMVEEGANKVLVMVWPRNPTLGHNLIWTCHAKRTLHVDGMSMACHTTHLSSLPRFCDLREHRELCLTASASSKSKLRDFDASPLHPSLI